MRRRLRTAWPTAAEVAALSAERAAEHGVDPVDFIRARRWVRRGGDPDERYRWRD